MNIKFILKVLNQFNPFLRSLEIYTDGSHKGKWGAWAFVVSSKGKLIYEASGREKKTNSLRMEFQAAIEAMKYLPKNTRASFYTDSRVLVKAMTQKSKRPLVNTDQLEVLESLAMQHKISWNWVKAHSGVIYNERCDELCFLARNNST